MPLPIRFHPRPRLRFVPLLAAVLVFGIALAAGQWQTGRAAEKEAIEARQAAVRDVPAIGLPARDADPETLDGRRMALRGEFLHDKTVFLDNQVHHRIAGYHVLTPLRVASGAVVLVNRGWVRAGSSRAELPAVAARSGSIDLEGRVALPPRRIYELKPEQNPGRVRQNLVLPTLSKELGLDLPPWVLRQTNDTGDGLARAWERPAEQGMTAAKHRGYAFQWYALAALTAFLFLFFTFFIHGEPSRNA